MNPEGAPPYGSGAFGRWTTDDFGLPAYLYTASDPVPWHQVGNDRITAIAHAGGSVELFTWETGAKWLNARGRGTAVTPAAHGVSPPGGPVLFGLGYVQRELSAGDLRWRETLYAPYGEFPFVVSRLDLSALRAVDWVASWTPRPRELFFTFLRFLQGPLSPGIELTEYDANRKIQWARVGGPRALPPEPRRRDPWFPDLFLAHRSGPLVGPEATGNRLALRYRMGPGRTCIEWAAGYCYDPRELESLLEQAPTLEQTVGRWKALAGCWSLPEEWVAREAAWSAYYLRSAALYDRYLEAHSIPQGGIYLYRWGVNGAPRDLAQHGWPLIYLDPPMAREVLKFLFRLQRPSGELPWDYSGFGSRDLHIMEPSDSDLWLFWFATEYIFATRDFGVLDEEFPYYPRHEGRKGTGWDHLRASWSHLRDEVGTGVHGLLRLKFSDWSDEMAPDAGRNPLGPLTGWYHLRKVRREGESTLNTAMACAVLPRLADLAHLRGDPDTAREIGGFVAAQRKVLLEQWRDRWFNRAYFSPRREVGRDRLYIEPQIWALLAGIPPGMEASVLKSLKTRSLGASPLGAVCLSPPEGQLTSRAGELTSGGVWYLLNMLLVEALSTRDLETAWAETKRNTLANHAALHPRLWYGIWSGNDSWNGPASPRPGEAPTGRIPWLNLPAVDYRTWPVQIAHSHGALQFMLLKMAGIGAGPDGYSIRPRFPLPEFGFEGQLLGVRYGAGGPVGYFRPSGGGRVAVEVAVPAGIDPSRVRVAVEGRLVEAEVRGGSARFPMDLRAGEASRWELNPKT